MPKQDSTSTTTMQQPQSPHQPHTPHQPHPPHQQPQLLLNLLSQFLQSPTHSPPQILQSSSHLIALAQSSPTFLQTSLDLLLHHDLDKNKLILLSTMVKDQFKYCFEGVERSGKAKMGQYCGMLQAIGQRYGIQIRALWMNVCQALAIIYIHAISIEYFALLQYLQDLSTYYYLKTLQYIPLNISSSRTVLSHKTRKTVKNHLLSQQLQIITKLNQHAIQLSYIFGGFKIGTIISCLHQWVCLKYRMDVFDQIVKMELVTNVMIGVVQNGEQADVQKVVEFMTAIVRMVDKPQNHQPLFKFLLQTSIHKLIPKTNQLLTSNNTDLACLFIEFLCQFTTTFIRPIVHLSSSNLQNAFLTPLLSYFYYSQLQQAIQSLIEMSQQLLQQAILVKQKMGKLQQQFREVPLKVVLGVIIICQYKQKCVMLLQQIQEHKLVDYTQEGAIVYGYRIKVDDIVKMAAQIIGVEQFLEFVMEQISKLNPAQTDFWAIFESLIEVLQKAIASMPVVNQRLMKLLDTYQREIRNKLFGPVPTIVKRTFLRLFRQLFYIPCLSQDLLQKLFLFTTEQFDSPLLFQTAQRTFYSGCLQNAVQMVKFEGHLFAFLQQYPYKDEIVKGYMVVVCHDGYRLVVKGLKCLIEELGRNERRREKREIVGSMIAAIKEIRDYRFQYKIDVVDWFTQAVWPFLMQSLTTPRHLDQDDDTQVQRIVRLLKTLMRTLRLSFSKYLIPLFTIVTPSFKQYPICSYLYLLQITITVFSNYKQYQGYLIQLHRQFCNMAFNHIEKMGVEECGYLVDDFLGMNLRILMYQTEIVAGSQLIGKLVEFATKECLETLQPKPVKAAYRFLQTLFKIFWTQRDRKASNKTQSDQQNQQQDIDQLPSRASPPYISTVHLYTSLKQLLLSKLSLIIIRMLQHLSSQPVQMTRQCILDAIQAQIKAFPLENVQLWEDGINMLNGDVFLDQEKIEFRGLMERMSLERRRGERTKDVVKEIMEGVQLIDRRMAVSLKRRKIQPQ